MIQLSDGRVIIGVDNGYQFLKTVNSVFENGVFPMEVEPSIIEHTMYLGRKYYKVGEGRANMTENKVGDENNKLLAYAGIAEELRIAGLSKADVILAVGLPFGSYGALKKKEQEYFSNCMEASYTYEGQKYKIQISKVYVFPQCFAAIAPRLGNMPGEYLIVDIGSKTIDAVLIKDGVPQESRSTTIEYAMIKAMRNVQQAFQSKFGIAVPESEIMKIILEQKSNLKPTQKQLIKEQLMKFMDHVEAELMERDFNLDFTKIIYVGGGAMVARKYSRMHRSNVIYDTDICCNAKGYEYLANHIVGQEACA